VVREVWGSNPEQINFLPHLVIDSPPMRLWSVAFGTKSQRWRWTV